MYSNYFLDGMKHQNGFNMDYYIIAKTTNRTSSFDENLRKCVYLMSKITDLTNMIARIQ